ncbi:hypothetical protein Tco_0227562 [Tanacetum coccineum]
MVIEVVRNGMLLGGKCVGHKHVVWMSHGNEAIKTPNGYEAVARSEHDAFTNFKCVRRWFYRLQYYHEWEMDAIRGSGNPMINSLGDRCAATTNPNAKEVLKRVEAAKPH